MYKFLLAFLLIGTAFSSQAQNHCVVKGLLVDSIKNEPMEFATVAVVNMKDSTSSLVAYTLTDKKGEFTLHNLPAGIPLKILITFVSYKPYRKFTTLTKNETVDLGKIRLSSKVLNEVTITAERPPVVVRKDTVEFAAEAFKTRPNAVVEELLKKLPGMEVDNQGLILFNGKKVKKVLVDGHEFFASDIRIATKNLDAEMIDKVQVYDDREDDPDHLVADANVEKIVNLKFKKKLIKSVFGKVYAGGGTEGRYESGGLFNLFKDTLQVSLLGLSNNLSNTGFDFNDLYSSGGLNRGGDAAFRGGGISYGSLGGGGGYNGISKTISGGVNINTDYGKKLKINLAYFYSHTNIDYNSMTNRGQLTQDTTFTTHSTTNRNNQNNRHNVTMSVRSKTDNSQLSYTPLFSFLDNTSGSIGSSSSFSNFIPQITNTTNTDNSTSNNLQFEHSFNYNKQLKKKGSSINIDHSLSINPDNNDDYNQSNVTSYVSTLPSYALNRYGYNRNKNISTNVNVAYRYPISKKITLDINTGEDFNQVISKGSTYDFDPATGLYDIYLPLQSTDLTRNLWKEHVSPGLTYAMRDNLRLVVSLNTQVQQVNNQFGRNISDIDKTYFNVLPTSELSYSTAKSGSYVLSYGQSVSLPNIGDMIPYSIVFSPLFTVTGNPDLKLSKRDNFALRYNVFNRAAKTSFNINASFSTEQNGVVRERTLNTDGAETTTPINKSGRYNGNLNAYLNKSFKKYNDLQLSETTSLGFSDNHNFFEINHQEGYQNLYNLSLNQRLSINWKDIITMDPSFNIYRSMSNYTGVAYPNIDNVGYSFDNPYTIYWPKHIDISGTYTYIYSPLVSPGYQKSSNLLNVAIARQFLKKDRAEIKLSCYDILNQAISSSRSVYENNITDTQSQIIKRYFLLTLRWKFNSSKTADKPSPFGPMMRLR